MSNHSRLHNPNYSGPGIWFSMHTDAAAAKTSEDKKYVCKQIRNKQAKFPCKDCKEHFGFYLQNNPPESTINGSEDALFLWTVNFHNAVNFRLGKPQVSYEDAKSIFYDDNFICMSECDKGENIKIKPRIVPKDLPGTIF